MTKLLLVDLDNTIRQPLSDNKFISHPQDQQIIPDAAKAIAHYHEQGWAIVGITNQGGVAAGHKSLEDCLKEQAYTLELCPHLGAIIFCVDFAGETRIDVVRPMALAVNLEFDYHLTHEKLKGTYRKPNPGMLLWAMEWLGVDKADCLYVGDHLEDEQAAQNAEIKFMWASDWWELHETSHPLSTP